MTETEFEKIYLEQFDAVHRYLMALCRDAQTADEITSDTFFKAMSAIDKFEGKCGILTWLCQIAKNTYISYLKDAKRTVPLDSVSEQSDAESDVEERAADAETSMRILKALHSMPEPYKEVFTLRVFGELSFKQIAEVFGKSDNWACVTYHRAKSKIESFLEDTK